MSKLDVYNLEHVPYNLAYQQQLTFLEQRINNEINDSLLLLQHPPTITLGRRGNTENLLINEDILTKNGIELVHSTRGGDITYHGPGQLVGYPIINLKKYGCDVHEYLRKIEEVLIQTLREFSIEGRRINGLTGVWVKRSKIASIGIAIRRWVTYHGFAINANTELSAFDLIIPCGINNVSMTSIKKITNSTEDIDLHTLGSCIADKFIKVFEFENIEYVNN